MPLPVHRAEDIALIRIVQQQGNGRRKSRLVTTCDDEFLFS